MNVLEQILGISPTKLGMEQFAKILLESIGSRLSIEDQEWLTGNLLGLPDYLKSEEGGKVMAAVVDCYRSSLKKLDWEA